MKKIFGLFTLISVLVLTGCMEGTATMDDINSAIERIEEEADVVIVNSATSTVVAKNYENDKESKTVTTYEMTYTFADNKLLMEAKMEIVSSYGSDSSKTVATETAIYDFEGGFYYEEAGKTGLYTKEELSSTRDYSYYYERYVDGSIFDDFIDGEDFTTEFEEESTNYKTITKIFTGSGDNITISATNVYNDDYAPSSFSTYYSYSKEEVETLSLTFKTGKISVPSENKILKENE